MDIVLNSEYQAASTKILIEDLGPKLDRHHHVEYNDWDNYTEYDLALFMRPDHVVKAREQNQNIGIGIMDAKISAGDAHLYNKADFLVVGSVEQKNKMLKYNDEVLIYRDFPEYDYGEPRTHRERKMIRLGYHGNRLHLEHFYPTLTGALDRLGKKYNLELYAIYNYKKHGRWKHGLPENIDVKHIQWSPDVYQNSLSEVDIGIKNDCIPSQNWMTQLFSGRNVLDLLWNINEYYIDSNLLERALKKQELFSVAQFNQHDYYTRYKYPTNPGRLYPFAQLNIPVVADFTPSNAELITHGQSGYLASTQESWITYITELIEHPEMREKQAQNLQKTIIEEHSLSESFERLNNYINDKFK